MFNGMMDPELMKIAQEQINRMPPSELAKIQQQMMSNPDLMRMASESMKNMRPEDLKFAAEQLKDARPEDMAEIGNKMANSTPEEIASMQARAYSQITYEISAAQMLKKQGNELHSEGRFSAASQKYLLAKKNLQGIPATRGRAILLACSLNLMSCYLKTKQYDECVQEGTEVLAYDTKNVKALYRRGQAFKEIGQLEDAVSDLSKALEVSPDDDTIAAVLSEAQERLKKEGGEHKPRKLVIEEITEEVEIVQPANGRSEPTKYSVTEPRETSGISKSQRKTNGVPSTNSESLEALQDDPEAIRSFQNFISGADPETLTALGGGKADGVPPDMMKTASNMISKMSPEELQRMIRLASSFQGQNPLFNGGSSDNSFRPGSVPPNMTPEMLKTASDMMSKMPPEQLSKMFEMASSLRGQNGKSATANLHTNGVSSGTGSKHPVQENPSGIRDHDVGESSSSRDLFSDSRSIPSESSFPSSTAAAQMRNQMKDPAMRQMLSSMMKNISPDMMANMSEQFGVKLSREDAERAQEAMSSLSPETLDRMMCWADRFQRGAEAARKTKNWLLGRPGMILAICMLILAVILHRLGYIS